MDPVSQTFSGEWTARGIPQRDITVLLRNATLGQPVAVIPQCDAGDTSGPTAGEPGPRGVRPAAPAAAQASGSVAARRYVPERPPVFSQSVMSPSTISRSADLHMS